MVLDSLTHPVPPYYELMTGGTPDTIFVAIRWLRIVAVGSLYIHQHLPLVPTPSMSWTHAFDSRAVWEFNRLTPVLILPDVNQLMSDRLLCRIEASILYCVLTNANGSVVTTFVLRYPVSSPCFRPSLESYLREINI